MARKVFTKADLDWIRMRGLALPTPEQLAAQRQYIIVLKELPASLVTEALVRQAYLEHYWTYLTEGKIREIGDLVKEILEDDKTPPTFEPGDEEE